MRGEDSSVEAEYSGHERIFYQQRTFTYLITDANNALLKITAADLRFVSA